MNMTSMSTFIAGAIFRGCEQTLSRLILDGSRDFSAPFRFGVGETYRISLPLRKRWALLISVGPGSRLLIDSSRAYRGQL